VTSEHGDNAGLAEFKSAVTAGDIKTYYQQNKADFRHVSASKARVLSFDDREKALTVAGQLDGDKSWQLWSQSLNQSGWFPGHQQGWVYANSKPADWLRTLAFTLPQGADNPPIRSPQGRWYVAKVEQKQTDYYPVDSETVIYQATNAIAKRRAVQAFNRLKQQLVAKADVKYHEL
jgi:hypothetical protein